MNKKLHCITQKIDNIHFALLRFQDKKDRVTMHVTAKSNEDNTLICITTGSEDLKKLANKRVNLIQKSEDDYLYIYQEK